MKLSQGLYVIAVAMLLAGAAYGGVGGKGDLETKVTLRFPYHDRKMAPDGMPADTFLKMAKTRDLTNPSDFAGAVESFNTLSPGDRALWATKICQDHAKAKAVIDEQLKRAKAAFAPKPFFQGLEKVAQTHKAALLDQYLNLLDDAETNPVLQIKLEEFQENLERTWPSYVQDMRVIGELHKKGKLIKAFGRRCNAEGPEDGPH